MPVKDLDACTPALKSLVLGDNTSLLSRFGANSTGGDGEIRVTTYSGEVSAHQVQSVVVSPF